MGLGRDQTHDPWICSQIRICSQTRYRLHYATTNLQQITISNFVVALRNQIRLCIACESFARYWALFFLQKKPGFQISLHNWKLFFLFLKQNICCEYSKEPSQWDGSFEHPKHMFELMVKKIIIILGLKYFLIWTNEKGYICRAKNKGTLVILQEIGFALQSKCQ